MRNLSKSKLVASRQCNKRLWLEVHRPHLREDSAKTQASFGVGNTVGKIAHQIYDAAGNGTLLDAQLDGFDSVFKHSAELLNSAKPIFEAGFAIDGALAFADVMLPVFQGGIPAWRMVEVKSATSVKNYYHDDVAIQSYIARNAGVPLVSISLAYIDSAWVYQGDANYHGLFKECDLTSEALSRDSEVRQWISTAHEIVARVAEPEIRTARHCRSPFACGFINYCQSQEPQAQYPVHWLPSINTNALKKHVAANPMLDLRDTPDDLLNGLQQRVKACTLSNQVYFDAAGAAAALRTHGLPAYFLDFETIMFAVPIWKGTRPYQQIPFQFSLHTLDHNAKLASEAFLDLSGNDPSTTFAETLINACGNSGPIFVYNAGFEGSRIKELAERIPMLAPDLLAIKERLVDLQPITKANYYHPDQHGSWSIKNVLPAIAPDLNYSALDGVQNGGMAMDAFTEAIHPGTTSARKKEIEKQLLAYCGLDTFAMVRLWQLLAGRQDLKC